jgi:hypothetical protein
MSKEIIVGNNSFKKPPPDPSSTTFPGGSLLDSLMNVPYHSMYKFFKKGLFPYAPMSFQAHPEVSLFYILTPYILISTTENQFNPGKSDFLVVNKSTSSTFFLKERWMIAELYSMVTFRHRYNFKGIKQ